MANIYDIARESGVSASTVSLVLSGRGTEMRISKATQEKIQRIASEMGYIPNSTARKLRDRNAKQFPEIALLWSPVQHAAFLNTFVSVLNHLYNEGKIRNIQLTVHPFTPGMLKQQWKLLQTQYFNGLICPPADSEDIAFINRLKLTIPTILLHGTTEKYNLVSVSNHSTGVQAARIFHAHGHKNVGIFSFLYRSHFYTALERCQAFCKEAERLGMQVTVLKANRMIDRMDEYTYQKQVSSITEESIRKMLPEIRNISALFLPNDTLALRAVSILREEGFRIPDDLEILAYGNSEALMYSSPTISTIGYPTEALSETSLLLMDELLDNPLLPPRTIDIPTSAIFRESCPKGNYTGE